MKKNFKIVSVFNNGMNDGQYLVEHLPSKTATVSYKRRSDAVLILNKASAQEDRGEALNFPFEHIVDGKADLGYWLK